GEHEFCPYLALELIDGGSLEEHARGKVLRPRSAARFLAKVARGVHAAHLCGIVHRDLKPGNILLPRREAAGETGPDFLEAPDAFDPKVTDFGLAKRLENEATQTETGAMLGTPSYMAPEQAQGTSQPVGPPADVIALGIILYELLIGHRPFTGT